MRLGVCLIAAALLGGCATHRPGAAGLEPLEAYMARVRQASVSSRLRQPSNAAATVEGTDPQLAVARLLVALAPTAAHHRLLAEEYARLGIADSAYNHYDLAVQLNSADAVSYEGRARIWRDWGASHLGLPDAYRAIYYAPRSPSAHNTLGTLLLRTGLANDARRAFERALVLDPSAAYALNNLCYAALVEGDSARAIDRCGRALEAQPDLAPARNNLALAYAAAGDLAAATREFSVSNTPARAKYNMGVALMATHRFGDAAVAFDEAKALDAALTDATARAKQARTAAARQLLEGSE